MSKSHKNPIINSEKNKYQFGNNQKRLLSAQKKIYLLPNQPKNIAHNNRYNSNEIKPLPYFNNHNEFHLVNNNINNEDINKILFSNNINNNNRIKRSDPKNFKKDHNNTNNIFRTNNIQSNLNLLKIRNSNDIENNQYKLKINKKSENKPLIFSHEKLNNQFENFKNKEQFQINNSENINKKRSDINCIPKKNQINNYENINKKEFEINNLKEKILNLEEKLTLCKEENLSLKEKNTKITEELNFKEL